MASEDFLVLIYSWIFVALGGALLMSLIMFVRAEIAMYRFNYLKPRKRKKRND